MHVSQLAWACAALLAVGGAHAATVEISIANLRGADGAVSVSLCEEQAFLKICPLRQEQKARSGPMVFRFDDVPPGRYAVSAYHDANGNGRLDRNSWGAPTEATGFSGNPRTLMGPPSFDEVAVDVRDGQQAFAVSLSY